MRTDLARRAGAAALAVFVATAAITVIMSRPAVAAAAIVGRTVARSAAAVTADALPTVQVDGVVLTEVVIGNVVYAGGSFTAARPAGAAPGTHLTPRRNLLAFRLDTGALITTFNPSLNGKVRSLAASPDGTRLYVGGAFTYANGVKRMHIAAYATATGRVINSWAPRVNGTVNVIVASSRSIYVGGAFNSANGSYRTNVAAFGPARGTLSAWAPRVNGDVAAMVIAPDHKRIILGGSFTQVDRAASYGMASVLLSNAHRAAWNITAVVRDAGPHSSITSLTTDGHSIFGTGYVFGSGGNLEGSFSANPLNGNINWIEDCHGDSYGSYAAGGVLYVVGHAHSCATIGGFPETLGHATPHRTVAFSTNATGRISTNTDPRYANFAGWASPSLIDWFPSLTAGTATEAHQGAWTVSGRGAYIVEGGEFTAVNGKPQQGLVRFALRPIAPGKIGPQLTGDHFFPSVHAVSTTSAVLTWTANYDLDDMVLTYRTVRSEPTPTQVSVLQAASTFWSTPALAIQDTGLTPGATYHYTVYASDPSGNTVASETVAVTMPTS